MNDALQQVWSTFLQLVKSSSKVQSLMKGISNGTATYQSAQEYSSALSNLLVQSASQVFPNDSQGVLNALKDSTICKNYFHHVDQYVYDLQKSTNQNNGLGMNAVKSATRSQIIDATVSSSNDYDADMERFASKAEYSSNSRVDDIERTNAEFQSNAGYKITVSRYYDGVGLSEGRVCEWCLDKCGVDIPYDEAYELGMFARHEGCGCIIEYNNNGEKSYQTSKGGNDSWSRIKLNEELSQSYKKVERTTKKDISIQTRNINRTINARKIKDYSNVYVSDNAVIKPKALHEINKYNNSLSENYQIEEKPNILIVSNEELNYNVAGVYLATQNIAVYTSDVSKETQRHEMQHCKQADLYKQKGGIINDSTYNEYMKQLVSTSKQNLERLGITEKNVEQLSEYAVRMYKVGRFDEVEAEYVALRGDK